MALRPLDDKVLIRVKDADEITKGGIIIPDGAKETPAEGEVVAIGIGRLLEDGTRVQMSVKVGDTVIYSKYAGSDVKDPEGNEFIIVEESSIHAIVE